MASQKKWLNFVENLVRDLSSTMKDGAIAKEIERITGKICTLHSVRKIRQRMGIKKKMGRPYITQENVYTVEGTDTKAGETGESLTFKTYYPRPPKPKKPEPEVKPLPDMLI